MGAALFITLEKEVDFDTFVNGNALSRTSDALDELAARLGVKPLMEFFSTDPENLPEEAEGIEITWKEEGFAASEGLVTVRALLSHLEATDVAGIDKDRVIAGLKEFEQRLGEADKQGIKWHLEVDY